MNLPARGAVVSSGVSSGLQPAKTPIKQTNKIAKTKQIHILFFIIRTPLFDKHSQSQKFTEFYNR